MNIKTLDSNLRQLSDLERDILAGHDFDYSGLPVAGTYNGRPYLRFERQTESSLVHADKNIRILENYQNLVIVKQGRFQEVPFHVHDWIELNYMYSGSCTFTINDTTLVLKTGQASLINTNAPHTISKCGEDDILINFVIAKHYLDSNFFDRLAKDNYLTNFFIEALNSKKEQDNFIIFHSENSPNLPFYVNQFLCEYYDNSISSGNILDCLMTLILCELINVFENDLSQEKQNATDSIVAPIIRYIEHNYNTCTLESTAKFFNLHPNYLSAYLKRYTGSSYKKLVQTQRLQQAVNLLKNSSLSVYDISLHVGYSNTSFFFQKFKEAYGCTPKEYRERIQ